MEAHDESPEKEEKVYVSISQNDSSHIDDVVVVNSHFWSVTEESVK